MTFVSYAQNFEDVLLWRALGDVQNGFYIDVGASHPDFESATRAFYDRGWRGINVEPTAASFLRLQEARPRDVNLRLALAETSGRRPLHVVDGANTGLSTVDERAAARLDELGLTTVTTVIETDTLASICRQHAPAVVHFLKIDVEGAERAVLEGADFTACRPWIILAEATAPMSTRETHADWDHILLDAAYRFVWFDGLNRFYVAAEQFDRLGGKFRTPPNVFDNFLRAADTEWTRRLVEAETRADASFKRAVAAEANVGIANTIAESASLRLARLSGSEARTLAYNERLRDHIERLHIQVADAKRDAKEQRERAARSDEAHQDAEQWLDAMRRSTSWRVTGPLRRFAGAARFAKAAPAPPGPDPDPPPAPAPAAPAPATPLPAERPPLRAVHQFHSGTAVGDAITNAMLLTRGVLRGLGYHSHIFAEHRPPEYLDEIHPITALPQHDRHALIVRHSMGHESIDRILALKAPKILLYHNITPSALLGDNAHVQLYSEVGRKQLGELRRAVVTSLADSDYNALELRAAGYGAVPACPILFDVEEMLANALPPSRGTVFTILFVGRLARAKGQLELVQAFARFRSLYAGEARLVLVGRVEPGGYADEVFGLIRRLKLDTGAIEVTGLVSDAERQRRYAEADLYVSMSQHEGFGVPLVEAMAQDVPVLAFAAGAVPYTLAGASPLLEDPSPARAAQRMLELAQDPAAREAIALRQRRSLDRFRLERQVPVLLGALERAGVGVPVTRAVTELLAERMQFTVVGHVDGSYSLAEINRTLAAALESNRPGTVRLVPVEGDVPLDLLGVPADQREAVGVLVRRAAPATGPHVVISQHYPVWAPAERGDLNLALFFWEESLIPAETAAVLNASFDGVLAPSAAVAKALVDSGVTVPVRILGHAPRLGPFHALREERSRRPPSGRFTFLHVSSGFPRKGADVLLAAYAAAFRGGDDVLLVIKVFPNEHNVLASLVERLRTEPGAPAVELIDRDLSEPEMLDLYRRADAMVLPTRGEGYNLPAAEALAAGLRLIVTGHGGHMDFVGRAPAGSVRLVDYTMTGSRSHLATPFSLWAEPDPDDLEAALREFADAGRGATPAAFPGPEEPLAAGLGRIAAELLQRLDRDAPRVAMMSTWDVPCGVAGYARHLARGLPLLTTVLADRRTAPAAGQPDVVPAWTVGLAGGNQELSAAIALADPEVLLIQHQPGLIHWPELPRLLGLPVLHGRAVCIVLHSTRHLLEIAPAQRDAALRSLAACTRVVVHTVHDLNRLLHLGLHGNVALIPQGVPERLGPGPEARGLCSTSAVTIGCYGFFLPDKGLLQLVEALPTIRRHFPLARLRLVNAAYPGGGSDEEMGACRRRVAALGLEAQVEFETEFLAEGRSAELLAGCDLIVLPYQQSNESSSAALRSAMQAGVPIAVTPLPLFDEADDAVHRLPGTSAGCIAEGVVSVLQDLPLRRRLVESASRWAALRGWSRISARWDGMIRALASTAAIGQDHGPR